MPRLDSPSSKLKTEKVKPFKRETLRQWDSIESITNRKRIDNDIDTNSITIREQIDTESITKPIPIDNNSITNRYQSGNVIENNPVTNFKFLLLSQLQQSIMFYIANECKKTGGYETQIIVRTAIAKALKTTEGSIKTSIRRLEQKRALVTLESKSGRAGWSRYKIPEAIFKEVLKHEIDNVIDNDSITKSITLYSSSNYIKTTTALAPEWQAIDYEPIRKKIGFGETQLRQLSECNASPEIVQDSIYQLAYGLERRTIENALNQFMGVLRKGQRWTEEGYKTPQELALLELQEERQQRQAWINERVNQEFPEWLKTLSEDEKRAIIPANVPFEAAKMSALRKHFVEQVLKIGGKL